MVGCVSTHRIISLSKSMPDEFVCYSSDYMARAPPALPPTKVNSSQPGGSVKVSPEQIS